MPELPIRSVLSRLAANVKSSKLSNYLIRRNPLYYQTVAREIARAARPGGRAHLVDNEYLLARALRWAGMTPYGRDYGNQLSKWPVLSKQQVQANPTHFRRRLSLAVPATTGGSSGTPLNLWRSARCIAAEQAFLDSLVAPSNGSLLSTRVAVLRADYVKDPSDKEPPYGQWKNGKRWLVLSSAHLSKNTIDWFHDVLTSFSPSVLWVYPSALGLLLKLLERDGLDLHVPFVVSSSESMSRSLYGRAGDQLDARVIDYYGQGERVCFASTDTSGRYWFQPVYGTVELDTTVGTTKVPDATTARIIATSHWNSAFPLVRYDIGDVALLPSGVSRGDIASIARGEEPFLGILGRCNDYVLGEDGTRYTGMNHIPWELTNVLQVQIIQNSFDSIRIFARCRGKLTSQDHDQLLKNAREIIPNDIKVVIIETDDLERADNGKTPFIIRRNISIPAE